MQFLLFRRVLATSLIAIAIASVSYIRFVENESEPRLQFAQVVLGIAGLLGAIFLIWDRFGGSKEKSHEPGTIDDYLNGLLRMFAEEETAFIPLAVETLESQYTTEKTTYDNIAPILELHKWRFVLIGDPGAGKSTTLRHLMIEQIRRYKANPESNFVPLWIDLGDSKNPVDAISLLEHWWHSRAFLPGSLERYIKQHNLWLFLDGLNEMPEQGGSRKERAAALRKFLADNPDLPVVVTCRIYHYEEDENLDLDLPTVTVQPLDDTRIQQFILRRLFDLSVWERIQEKDALYRMAQNPYNLAMLISLYKPGKALPENLNDLYSQYIRARYEEYKRENKVRLELKILERRLQRLAFYMIMQGKGTSAEEDWAQGTKPWQDLKYIVKNVPIVYREYLQRDTVERGIIMHNFRKIWGRRWKYALWTGLGRKALHDGYDLGVLVADAGVVRFYHQSLQIYFATIGIKAKSHLDLLISLLRYENFDFRSYAIQGLVQIGEPAIPKLISLFYDKEKEVRFLGVFILSEIGASSVNPTAEIASRETNEMVQHMAILTLESIGADALPALLEVARSDNEPAMVLAMIALRKMDDIESLSDLAKNPSMKTSSYSSMALGEMGERAIPVFIDLLREEDNEAWFAAGHGLYNLGDVGITTLTKLLNDQSESYELKKKNHSGIGHIRRYTCSLSSCLY